MTLNEILAHAGKEKWATGHFNVSALEQMRLICRVCKGLGSPAIIGTSEGEREYMGLLEAAAMRQALRREFGIPVFLNADHTKSAEAAKKAIDAGYDSIHIDLSALPFEENAAGTKEIVEYARSQVSSFKFHASEISVEGELGYLRGDSKIHKEKIEVRQEDYTNPEEAAEFVKKTGVDRLAVAVGNIHGISLDEPALDIERIKKIRTAVPQETALVLHAGSGIPDDQIRAAIEAGIANIHINTDLRVAYAAGLREGIQARPEETTPYKLLPEAEAAMRKVVEEKLKLFGSVQRL